MANAWEDEDEKTTVFDRSHAESAQALLQKAPVPAAGAPARSALSNPPPPAPVSIAPAPTIPRASIPVAAATLPRATIPPTGALGQAPRSQAPQPENKTKIYAAIAAVVVVIAAFFFMGGDSGGLVVTVAGPGGTAIDGVTVFVDDKEVCKSSTCKVEDLDAGSYVIKAVAEGYAEMAGKAYELEAGEQKAINIELVDASGGTGLKISSESSGLTLIVDGKKIGAVPQELKDLEAGGHKIELVGSPFIEDYSQTVQVVKGEILEIEPELKLIKGQVNISLDQSAKGAKVALIVNGKRRSLSSRFGKSGTKSVKIDLPLEGKTYKIRATRNGYGTFEKDLQFTVEDPIVTLKISLSEEEEGDDNDEADAAPAPRSASGRSPAPRTSAPKSKPSAAKGKGKLNINSIPKSNVILDGRPLGSTPKFGVSVSPGAHTVMFVHPQHGRKTRRVNVKSGGTATAAVRFP